MISNKFICKECLQSIRFDRLDENCYFSDSWIVGFRLSFKDHKAPFCRDCYES